MRQKPTAATGPLCRVLGIPFGPSSTSCDLLRSLGGVPGGVGRSLGELVGDFLYDLSGDDGGGGVSPSGGSSAATSSSSMMQQQPQPVGQHPPPKAHAPSASPSANHCRMQSRWPPWPQRLQNQPMPRTRKPQTAQLGRSRRLLLSRGTSSGRCPAAVAMRIHGANLCVGQRPGLDVVRHAIRVPVRQLADKRFV